MTIQDAEGNDIEVFTADEVAAQAAARADAVTAELAAKHADELKAKDDHLATKLDEFVKGKKSVEDKATEADTKIAEALRIANEANEKVNLSETKKNDAIKNFWITQTVGTDADLTEKLKNAYDLINMPITTENDIAERMKLAANMIGLTAPQPQNISFAGGVAPVFQPAADRQNEMDYDTFEKELGLKLPEQPKTK